ncbi:MAG: GntR family transcriptional regulator [Gammaproteobacteria bacterium]|nr:GntR family transcriptional regulator [Gammaproteobacteria bacterium]
MSGNKSDIEIPESYALSSTGRPATDLVMGHILESLVDGKMVPGQRVNATQLADELNVSIVPVREALHFLAGEGVIKLMALKGARISTVNADEIVDWWNIFRALAEISFEPCARAIVKDPQQALRIAKKLDFIAEAEKKSTPARFIMTLADFHRLVHSVSDKPVLDDAMKRLQVVFWCSFLPTLIPFEVYGPLFVKHYRLVGEALMRGDFHSARSIFRHHVNWSSAIIEGDRPEPGAAWVADRQM